jgi:DNA-binding transcriptional ArsR family regulator
MILCILSEGEKSVSELEEILAMPQAAVSQQLARLRLDGLVDTRREGRMIYYSILNHEVSSVIGTLYTLFCAPVRNPSAIRTTDRCRELGCPPSTAITVIQAFKMQKPGSPQLAGLFLQPMISRHGQATARANAHCDHNSLSAPARC